MYNKNICCYYIKRCIITTNIFIIHESITMRPNISSCTRRCTMMNHFILVNLLDNIHIMIVENKDVQVHL